MDQFIEKDVYILIVDDNPQNIQVLGKMLSNDNYNLEFAVDGKSALEWIQTKDFDLVLLDIMMPGMNGLEVCRKIRQNKRNKDVPIIFLSADSDKETILSGFEAGGQDYVTKPFDHREMIMRVKTHISLKHSLEQLEILNRSLEKKVLERTLQLSEAKEKAEASDRLKTAFLNNISHEVRTPLNGILGFARIITEPDLTREKKQEYLKILNNSGDRLLRTITEYTDISLIASGNQKIHISSVSLFELCNKFFAMYNAPCKEKGIFLKLENSVQHKDLIIDSDSELLSKIIDHLMNNALKFTNQGAITFGFKPMAEWIEFFVKDTGVGIEKKALAKIFGYFEQEDISISRGYDGNGLGLSIARGFVGLLEGDIWCESEKGKGSVFYFKIPAGKSMNKANESEKQKEISIEHSKTIILIAEDDENNFEFLKELFLGKSIIFLHARNGREAVDICKQNKDISLVLMDLKMPVLNGYNATKQIKGFRKDLPIIAVTAYAMLGDENLAKEAGCDEYITKPIDMNALEAAITKYTGRHLNIS